MNTKYNDIDITYEESDNRWHFELRGRQRSAESLSKAKEYIDKPVNTKEEKPFQRVRVYTTGRYGGDEFKIGEVTSVAESSPYSSTKEVWVAFESQSKSSFRRNKEREKCAANRCFPISEKNTALINQIKEVDKQIESLEEKNRGLRDGLTPLEV